MALTDTGAVLLAQALVTQLGSSAYLGVGDSSTAFNKTQTDLQAATNKLRKAMDATYPTRSSGTITFQSTYTTAEANFAWAEWGVFSASSGGTMAGRKVESLGTKTGSQTWQLQATATLTAP